MHSSTWDRIKNYWFIYPFFLLWGITPILPNWGVIPPKSCLGGCGTIEGMIPFVQWVNNLIDILRNYEIFGFFTFREFTRSIANLIDIPLDFTEALLYKGFNTIPLGPMPWVMILGLVILLGLYLRGVNLAILGGACVLYLAIFSLRGIWTLSMKTLAAIAVSVPLAVIIGILLGILGAKFKVAERILNPILNILQSLPHFSYLILVAIFCGVGAKRVL